MAQFQTRKRTIAGRARTIAHKRARADKRTTSALDVGRIMADITTERVAR